MKEIFFTFDISVTKKMSSEHFVLLIFKVIEDIYKQNINDANDAIYIVKISIYSTFEEVDTSSTDIKLILPKDIYFEDWLEDVYNDMLELKSDIIFLSVIMNIHEK